MGYYEFEMINGRECLTGGHSWKGMPVKLPGPDGPQALKDENGDYQWIKGPDGNPVFAPLMTNEEKEAVKEKKKNEDKIIKDLAKAMVEGNISVDDLLSDKKLKKVVE